jgi:hypothetical protein
METKAHKHGEMDCREKCYTVGTSRVSTSEIWKESEQCPLETPGKKWEMREAQVECRDLNNDFDNGKSQ